MNIARMKKPALAAHVVSVQFCDLNLEADKLRFFAQLLERRSTVRKMRRQLKAATTIVRDAAGRQIQPREVKLL